VDDQVAGEYLTLYGEAVIVADERVAELTWPLLLAYMHPAEATARWERINAGGSRSHRPAPGERDRPLAGQVIMASGQQTRGSGPVTAWGMAGSSGLVSGAAEPRMAAPASTAAASPKAAP
jgi:hypothetical protein